MDVYRNVSVSGGEKVTSPAGLKLEEFFPGENTAEGDVDVSQEWLSIFVEDCLSSTTNYSTITSQSQAPAPTNHPASPTPKPSQTLNPKPSLQDLVIPAKARTKRSRTTPSHGHHSFHVTPSDPLLLHQAYWLADSELIFPKKEQEDRPAKAATLAMVGAGGEEVGKDGSLVQPRRCSHCLSQRTPQWRAGPLGPKTLCNACGVRFKSGRLLPEYRPAKSPTFVSFKHSNSHKKVMEMRMAVVSSHSN